MAVAIKQFLLGYALSLPRHINKKESITALKILSIGIVFFAVFSTAVGNQRAKVTNQKVHEYENNIIRLSSGIIEYLTMHYWGYQLRRVDYTKDNLKYGVDTFYGFINIKVPFASQIGLEKGLPGLLGINHDPLEIYKSKRVGYYTTHSIYIQIISDFGPKGAYVFIALFTLYTQILFLRLISRPKFSAISFFMFYLCFTYWSSSNFSSAYGSNIINSIFIPFFLFDILQRVRFQLTKN